LPETFFTFITKNALTFGTAAGVATHRRRDVCGPGRGPEAGSPAACTHGHGCCRRHGDVEMRLGNPRPFCKPEYQNPKPTTKCHVCSCVRPANQKTEKLTHGPTADPEISGALLLLHAPDPHTPHAPAHPSRPMQCLGARIALAPAGLRRAKPARQARPLSRVAASESLETSKAPKTSKAQKATVADVEPVEADVNALRAWREQCPELRALWAGLYARSHFSST